MILKRPYVFLILLLLAEWTSGLAVAACPSPAPRQQPRVSRQVYPIALRYSQQLREHIALTPLLPGETCLSVREPPPVAGREEAPRSFPPVRRLLYTHMSLQR